MYIPEDDLYATRHENIGDIIEPAADVGEPTDTEQTKPASRNSSSEMGSDISYAEIARRQAEAFGFGVGFASASEIATHQNQLAISDIYPALRSPSFPFPTQDDLGIPTRSFAADMQALDSAANDDLGFVNV